MSGTSPPPSAIYVVGEYSRILRFDPDTFAEISPDDPLKEPHVVDHDLLVGGDRRHCRMERFTSDPYLVAFSSASPPYNVRVFNIETRTRVVTMNPSLHGDHTDGLAVIDDELTRRTTRPLVVSGDDNSLGVIWDATTGKVVAKNDELPIDYICRLLYVSDWNQSLFACGNSPDCIFRLDLERALTAVDGWMGSHRGQVDDISADVEKNVVATIAYDRLLKLWDIRGSNASSIKLEHLGSSVLCLPDRHQVLAGLAQGFDVGACVELFDLRNLSRKLSSLELEESISSDRSVYALERVRQNSFAGIVCQSAAFLVLIKPTDQMVTVAVGGTRRRRSNFGIRMLGDRLDDEDSAGVQDELERIRFLMGKLSDDAVAFGRLYVISQIVLFPWCVEI